MNTPDHPSLRVHSEAASLEKLRRQVLADMETLRAQEHNLRRYEAQLRGSQPPMPVAAAPTGLEAEREKISRLRALLEAERRALVDERLAVREDKEALAIQAEALKQREAWIELREREALAKTFPPPARKPGGNLSLSAKLGLTELPFAGYFRSQRRSA